MEEKPLVPIKRNRPTHKQMKTLQILKEEEGISLRKAMLKAGYSLTVANKGKEFFKMDGVQNALSSLKSFVTKEGLTSEKMAKKYAEWIDAKKPFSSHTEPDKMIPDYDTQLKAYDRWEKIMGYAEGAGPKVKRRLTVEEFVNDELKDES